MRCVTSSYNHMGKKYYTYAECKYIHTSIRVKPKGSTNAGLMNTPCCARQRVFSQVRSDEVYLLKSTLIALPLENRIPVSKRSVKPHDQQKKSHTILQFNSRTTENSPSLWQQICIYLERQSACDVWGKRRDRISRIYLQVSESASRLWHCCWTCFRCHRDSPSPRSAFAVVNAEVLVTTTKL